MIRRSPSEYYIKYLLVHPDEYDNEKVRSICLQLGIEVLGNWYMNQLRFQCQPPDPFYPQDFLHAPSQKFLRRECLYSVFHPDEHMQLALKVLDKPRVREVVEVMALSGAPSDAIAYALQVRTNFPCTEQAVNLYRHYFWDIDLLDSNEMRAFLQMKQDRVAESADPEIKYQYTYLNKNKHTDPRIVASKLPVSPLSAVLSQIQVGVMPKGVALSAVLENVRLMASLRALESTTVGGPYAAGSSQSYMVTADIANKILETLVKPEDELRRDLMNISLKVSTKAVPVIADLSGGSHTVEILPEPGPGKDEATRTATAKDQGAAGGPQK